jgi:hypothetical protein
MSNYTTPPILYTADGIERRVGFEIEFGHLSIDQTVEIIQKYFNAKTSSTSKVEKSIHTELGEFKVEMDWQFLKEKSKNSNDNKIDWLSPIVYFSSKIIPLEVVCPPVKISELSKLDNLVAKLRLLGAKGTQESIIAAYGVHINTELPSLGSNTILSYLKSFSILQSWLVKKHKVDLSRKLTPYIDLYPNEYVLTILKKDTCSIEELFDDYFKYNATRNRALDLLPLLAHLNKNKVNKLIDDKRIKSRPTFHYRMPNCSINDNTWNLSNPWNIWCVVETLANNQQHINELSSKYLDEMESLANLNKDKWIKIIENWLPQNGYI